MSHLTEEQLVFHYYGEEGENLAIESHLEDCAECRALYGSLQRVLNVVDSMPAPERGAGYGAQVWQRLEAKLPPRRWWQAWVFGAPGGAPPLRWAFSMAAVAALLVVAFLAGRSYPTRPAGPQLVATADPQARDRVLLVAVGDYLDRSQMMLVELANSSAKGSLDISAEQERAQDLISETRLYRQTAASTDNTPVAGILDELERVLLDIAHGPSRLSPAELEKFRARLEAEGILFKIRVVNSNVRSQEEASPVETPRQKL
jgi:hypothetical protein